MKRSFSVPACDASASPEPCVSSFLKALENDAGFQEMYHKVVSMAWNLGTQVFELL